MAHHTADLLWPTLRNATIILRSILRYPTLSYAFVENSILRIILRIRILQLSYAWSYAWSYAILRICMNTYPAHHPTLTYKITLILRRILRYPTLLYNCYRYPTHGLKDCFTMIQYIFRIWVDSNKNLGVRWGRWTNIRYDDTFADVNNVQNRLCRVWFRPRR